MPTYGHRPFPDHGHDALSTFQKGYYLCEALPCACRFRTCVRASVRACTGRLKDVHQCTDFITGPVNYSAQVPQIRLGGIAACSEDLQLFVNRSQQHFGLFG